MIPDPLPLLYTLEHVSSTTRLYWLVLQTRMSSAADDEWINEMIMRMNKERHVIFTITLFMTILIETEDCLFTVSFIKLLTNVCQQPISWWSVTIWYRRRKWNCVILFYGHLIFVVSTIEAESTRKRVEQGISSLNVNRIALKNLCDENWG